jgi:hypothetical protein
MFTFRALTLKPQVRFLLRSSALLTGMLALWWFALQPPMLFLLRVSESVALRLLSSSGSAEPIAEDPSGDWNFRVPVEDTQSEMTGAANPVAGSGTGPVKFRAIEFTIPQADVVLFTFSLPVYWAIILAVPGARPSFRALLWGTVVISSVEVLSLMALVEITAYAVVAQWHPPAGALAAWSREAGTNLVVGVIPFAAPVLTAVALHPGLRAQIFPGSHPEIIKADGSRAGTPQGIQVQRQAFDRHSQRDSRGRSR